LSVSSKDVSAIYELIYNPKYAPQKSSTSHIERLSVDGEPAYILTNESTGEYYEVDEITDTIWNLVDGGRTLGEIWTEARRTDDKITEKEVRDVIVSLAEEGTIESSESEVEQRRVEMVSALQLDIRLMKDSSQSLAPLFWLTRKLFNRGVFALAVAVSVLGMILFAGTFARIFADPSAFEVAGSTLFGLLFYESIVLLPVYLIHELAHAASCDYFGGKPRALGTGLYYLSPFFFTDTSDSWRLSRRARILISLAGPLSTLVIGSIFVFSSYLLPPGFGKNVLQVGAFFSFYGTLLNFSPVIETDGYYILADVLKIPNLRDESLGYIKSVLFRKLGRPATSELQDGGGRRVFLLYGGITTVWLCLFGYSSIRLMYVYGSGAYSSLTSLSSVLLQAIPFDLVSASVNVAALAYFALFSAGFVVMGATAYRSIRIRGIKLETIHDKRVSVFLPLPSFFPRRRAGELVDAAKALSRKLSRSSSVTWEPPLCVAALKLGKVDETLDHTRRDMIKVERSFRSLHSEFLSKNAGLSSKEASGKKATMNRALLDLANRFPALERKEAIAEAVQLREGRDELIARLLESAFGTVWTLELSPEDYQRIRGEMLPSLTADDLGLALSKGLEHFKKHTVLGLDAIAQLASEIEKESGKVKTRPELYQLTAFIEPIKSRLAFVGRTESVEGSIVWLGGLFLYQSWTGFMNEALGEAAMGLKSIRPATSYHLTKEDLQKLAREELGVLRREFVQFRAVNEAVKDAMGQVQSTYMSAQNFHEALNSLVSDVAFDVGLYRPILVTNGTRLASAKGRIEQFTAEFERVYEILDEISRDIEEEQSKRSSTPEADSHGFFASASSRVLSSFRREDSARRSPTYEAGIKLLFATSRMVYDIVIASDLVI